MFTCYTRDAQSICSKQACLEGADALHCRHLMPVG